MTTTTESFSSHARRSRLQARRGATLVELIVAMTISAVVLTAVASSFLLLARSSLQTTSYSGMDKEARVGLERFSREVRMASNVSNFDVNGVTLRVPTSLSAGYDVTYRYVPEKRTFYRNYGLANETALISGVDTFELKRYSIFQDPATGLPAAAKNDIETKQLQIQLRAERSNATRAQATNNVISARYILRNKSVSN